MFYYCRTYYKAVRVGGEDSGGHVLRDTTSRGLCGLVCRSRTSERGGWVDCVKEGGGAEGECERERALGTPGDLEKPPKTDSFCYEFAQNPDFF